MTKTDDIVRLNAEHPDWNDEQLAVAVGCSDAYVRAVCRRKGLVRASKPRPRGVRYNVKGRASKIAVRIDPDMETWIYDEAQRMGADVNASDVIVAILQDAMAGD